MLTEKYKWARYAPNNYEISSRGDKRFSALFAKMSDGRTIEMWYQCDIKGYNPLGKNWRAGKGKPPLYPIDLNIQWEMYLNLWRIWGLQNIELLEELAELAEGKILTDMFATTEINQARALATILNDWAKD